MTTLISWLNKDFIIMACDSQVTEGNLRLPVDYEKIRVIDNQTLVGGCGGVGLTQQVLDRCIKNIKINKIESGEENLNVTAKEIAITIAHLNFNLPLEFKHFTSAGFLIGGIVGEEFQCFSVGADGANIQLQTYYADGSGSQFALSLLQGVYDPHMDFDNALNAMAGVMKQVTEKDVYTDHNSKVFGIRKDENGDPILIRWRSSDQIKENSI